MYNVSSDIYLTNGYDVWFDKVMKFILIIGTLFLMGILIENADNWTALVTMVLGGGAILSLINYNYNEEKYLYDREEKRTKMGL